MTKIKLIWYNFNQGIKSMRIKRDEATFKQFIKKIAEGNEKGFEGFYNTYVSFIFTVALSVCKAEDLANEIVDDVLIKIWNSAETLKDIKNPDAWLYTVTLNFAKSKIKQKRENLPLTEEIVSKNDSYKKVLDKDSFYFLIKPLSLFEQEIFVLRFLRDKTFKEIARIMNRPIGTITSVYYTSLKKIKNFLEKEKI